MSVQRREQRRQIVLVQLPLALAAAVEYAPGQVGLGLLQLLDLLFDAATGDQFVDEYRLVLADAVGAVAGLGFGGRVPPGIEVDHRVGGGQV